MGAIWTTVMNSALATAGQLFNDLTPVTGFLVGFAILGLIVTLLLRHSGGD